MGERSRAGRPVDRRVLMGLLAGLAACGPVTGGRLLADPAVLRAIRTHYDAHALEDPACGEPFVTRLLSGWAEPSAVHGAPDRVIVDYAWEAPPQTPGGRRCAGEGRRTFWVLRTSEGPRITAMSGPTRAPRSAP
ncbi:MAG: hypothetical protein NZ555_11775 [Geminicoccaceae bacterium]|nr:hypothetical protein [Geminicoccaceae bacterium]MCX8100196.1 hypothetical protein [Geminicoccaceae bacterium]